ncbi:hypothetical protein ACFPN2_34735 [Steroidobacter flavus]|uniref:Uncharacterized protein n=1 Tax=Steroidobacter flavus TaxID=1842136 RepID=A0ABV8T5Q0_9GAMM
MIDGTVVRLQCEACGAVFPYFRFTGDVDSDTDGLYSATSCTGNELVIAEATPSEWNEMGRGDGTSTEKNLAQQLGRTDLKIVHLVRVEDTNAAKGLSFAEFQKVYKPPVLIYSCPCCADGESRAVEELTAARFKKSGGKIELLGPLRLLA